MQQPRFNLNYKDDALLTRVKAAEHRSLAEWASDCAARVLPYFTQDFTTDHRPQAALATLHEWIRTGQFSMSAIRGAALAAHAAAREVGADTPARSAARAAGQAVACAHVPMHALAAANYALQAIHRAHSDGDPDSAVAYEREWQHLHLMKLQAFGLSELPTTTIN